MSDHRSRRHGPRAVAALAATVLGASTWFVPVAASAATTTDRLTPGQVLAAGERLLSTDHQTELVMQGDGNLVVYNNGGATWASHTSGSGNRATEQTDGNLVVYSAGGTALWSSRTSGSGSSTLIVQNDGNVVNYRASGGASWSTNTGDDTLFKGAQLLAGQGLLSRDRQQTLEMQGDGNLVVYSHGAALWASRTSGSGNYAAQQTDGNLVVYSSAGQALWTSSTAGKGATRLVMQDDGNLVQYNGGTSTWSTRTVADSVYPGHLIALGGSFVSRDHTVHLAMQTDGNLVLSTDGRVLWSSGTSGRGATGMSLQSDGNLVLRNAATAVWSTGTAGRGGKRLIVQNDGNLVLYDGANKAIWQSHTFKTGTSTAGGAISTAEILRRAQTWIDAGVPYSAVRYRQDANGYYRQDCSGFVSMAWHLTQSLVTGTFLSVSHEIPRSDLQPGDALLRPDEHIAMFLRWADASHTAVIVQEESGAYENEPAIQDQWGASYASTYLPIRYDNKVG